MNDFQILQKLGEGAYSTVYKVKRLVDNNIYALKKVKLLNLSDKEKSNALNEVRILASVKSKYVISYKEAFFDEKDSTLGIVMEYADKGDLYQKIIEHKKTAKFFEESEIWRIFIQLVKGLKALHDLKILHRDLKSANVFLLSDGTAKLGDLNVSKVARRGLGYTQTGTPYYASPEVWKDEPYDNKSDIWSLGCVLYEMITLRPPFRAENMEGLFQKVIKGQIHRIPDRFSEDLFSIVKLLLQVNSDNRPSCDRILKNVIVKKRIEYFNSFDNNDNEDNDDQLLLRTIKIPKNLLFLSDKLPKPNYDKHMKNMVNSNSKMNIITYRSYPKNKLENKIPPLINQNRKIEKKGEKRLEKDLNELKSQNNVNMKENDNSISNIYLNIREDSSKSRKGNHNYNYNYNYNNRGQIDISTELPQLNVLSSNRQIISGQKKNGNKKNKNHLDELYKIYAPYLKPVIKYKKYERNKYNRYKERNYDYNLRYPILEISNSNIMNGPENKIIPKRKLSPLKIKL
jgi:NIMA (never in mitosis gene a)-related kinase